MEIGSLGAWVAAGAAAAGPDKVAVTGAGEARTYRALLAGARGIAARLREAGIGRGDRVGLWMEKKPACVEALLGVLLSGAAYVPLDPRSPWARCRSIARDAGLAGLVIDGPRVEHLPSFLDGLAIRLVVVEGGDAERAAAAAAPALVVRQAEAAASLPGKLPEPAPDDLAYVLYTSGSTGTPKGVAHTHRSGLAFARWVQGRFGIRPDDVFSSHAPFHFDLSISDLFVALGSGASVRLIAAGEGMLAPWLVRGLSDWGITVWYSVPSILVSMLEVGDLEARAPRQLRLLLFAGEVFPMPWLRRLRRALPETRLVNLFGPTETNVCTYHEVPAVLPEDQTALPIGVPCENLEGFVLDDAGRELSGPGDEGTLWVKGENLMAGYWNDPERTARVLAEDPRGGRGIACNTGDRVRIRPGGGYDFRGRRDHLVKTRGYRVELGEIEAVLASHPGVREAVAVPVPDPTLGNRIVATVVPRAGEALDARALRAFVGGVLPGYMVPAAIELRPELPRTSTGKADRSLLLVEWTGREAS